MRHNFYELMNSINLCNHIYTYVKIDVSEIHQFVKLIASKYTLVVKMKVFKRIVKKNEIFFQHKKIDHKLNILKGLNSIKIYQMTIS